MDRIAAVIATYLANFLPAKALRTDRANVIEGAQRSFVLFQVCFFLFIFRLSSKAKIVFPEKRIFLLFGIQASERQYSLCIASHVALFDYEVSK